MLVTFTKLYDKLLSGEKTQTIRVGWRRYHDFISAHYGFPVAHIYWGNPRNGGIKMGEGVFERRIDVTLIGKITDEIAIADGFINKDACIEALLDINKDSTILTEVGIIKWDWDFGPVDVKKGEVWKDVYGEIVDRMNKRL